MMKPLFFIILFLSISFADSYGYSPVLICSIGDCTPAAYEIPYQGGGGSVIPPTNITAAAIVPTNLWMWIDFQVVGFLTNVETAIFIGASYIEDAGVIIIQRLAQFDAWLCDKTVGIANIWFAVLTLLAMSYVSRRKIAVPAVLIFIALFLLIRHFDCLF
jgi:hypothetical protein